MLWEIVGDVLAGLMPLSWAAYLWLSDVHINKRNNSDYAKFVARHALEDAVKKRTEYFQEKLDFTL